MNCPNCGKEIEENCIICPWCGQEIQVISAMDELEEEILKDMVDEDGSTGQIGTASKSAGSAGSPGGSSKGSDASVKSEGSSKKKKQKRKRRLTALVIVVAAVIAAAVVGVKYYHGHSAAWLLKEAEAEYEQKDYDSALEYLERIIALGKEDEDSLLLLGQVNYELGDYDSAETCLISVITLDPASQDAYRTLCDSYYAEGDMDSIIALHNSVTDPDILAIIEEYLVAQPELSVEGGEYDEYQEVELSAPEQGLVIYYTLDGSIPDDSSEKYTTAISIEEQGVTVLTAVCKDEKGFYSEPVIAEYDIELAAPDAPVATPDGGTFSKKTTVTITAQEGCRIYYTWDNTVPDEYSREYTGPITVPEGNNILSIVAIDGNGQKSDVLKCNYIYYAETKTAETPADTDEDATVDTSQKTGAVTGQAEVIEPTEPETDSSDESTETD
ncbi:MAG: chitobiase/beta-hexosaminidase C-terminal domain-containing protein [Clostridiales bacterium]|nr:chitobiase/beta-hexosaminidase C-terminal domain-containing protein [Clostridiales bacterium]